jgi:hypothetical protein
MTEKLPDSEKLLFDYFLNELDFYSRKDIKTSKDLIEYYRENIIIKDGDDSCSCCGGERNIVDDD